MHLTKYDVSEPLNAPHEICFGAQNVPHKVCFGALKCTSQSLIQSPKMYLTKYVSEP